MHSPQNKSPDWLNILLAVIGVGLAIYLLIKLLEALSSANEPEKRPRVFISHSWTFDEHFNKIIGGLDHAGFNYYNHSVLKDRPLDIDGDKQLEEGIRNQMRNCSKVVVLAGPYVDKSDPIKMEIRLAGEMGKDILAIKPWGQTNLPKALPYGTKVITNITSILEYLKK